MGENQTNRPYSACGSPVQVPIFSRTDYSTIMILRKIFQKILEEAEELHASSSTVGTPLSSVQVILPLSSVCSAWRAAARGLELLHVKVKSTKGIDALLAHIRTCYPLIDTSPEVEIISLAVAIEPTSHFEHCLRVLLLSCHNSLKELSLTRKALPKNSGRRPSDGGRLPPFRILSETMLSAGGSDEYFFPNLESLTMDYSGLQHPDILDFLHSFDPVNILSLSLYNCDLTHIEHPHELPGKMPNIFDLRLESLLGLENDVASHIINAAENVEVLQLVFKRSEVVQLMELLSKSELGTLDMLKIWIQVDTKARAIGDADMQPLINYACRTPWTTVFCVYTDVEYW